MNENSYGVAKRLEFASQVINECKPRRVLDIGCGTGVHLTQPLAIRFEGISFVGVDSDVASIEFANRSNAASNIRYICEVVASQGQFDLIIASEVIEHVEQPDEFLIYLRTLLTDQGRVILTLPNGLGGFEFASLVETVGHMTGVYGFLRAIKRRLRGTRASAAVDSLAISPHINFFTFSKINALIVNSGFQVVQYLPRTLLCGFIFDQVITSKEMLSWNAHAAERLPPQFASGWMFLLVPRAQGVPSLYKRGLYARFRRFLNEKRWNLR